MRPLGYRVEDYFRDFPSLEWGGFGAVDLAPFAPSFSPLLLPFNMGFGVGRTFFGSGLLGGFDFSFGNNSIGADVWDAATRLSGWGNILEVDPFWRGASAAWPSLPFPIPFPFANPLAPSAQAAPVAATPYAPSASAPAATAAPQYTRGGADNDAPPKKNAEAKSAENTEKNEEEDKTKETGAGNAGGAAAGAGEGKNGAKKTTGTGGPPPKPEGKGIPIAAVAGKAVSFNSLPEGARNEVNGIRRGYSAETFYPVTEPRLVGDNRAMYFAVGNSGKVHLIFQNSSGKWDSRVNFGTLHSGALHSEYIQMGQEKKPK